ncbi:hypothetical protein AK830_g9997 [Neonectria ditissima]|uniref:DUF7580 domain-containing protein n=1 Tax=Neonectria ditissima TaxID=78410 RepID=A0A0P7AGS7_9HYPO|nr:hypothetical protein AK830_g9997 [Neonectria ditissima]
MSGVEFILSAVLAAIPLAIEAYDHSERVFESFSVFKQYPREVLKLEAKLGAQRTIFRNHTINLLTAITNDRDTVQDVMSRPSSEEARQGLMLNALYRNRVDSLKGSFLSCQKTVAQINDSLQRLCSEAQAFRVHLSQDQDVPTVAERLRQIRTRFKLSLNKPQIEKAIGELREFNTDFCSIISHIIRALPLLVGDSKQPVPSRKSAKTLNCLQRYRQIRTASSTLYSTLTMQWTCPSHCGHIANLCLLHEEHNTPTGTTAPRLNEHVSFDIAISHEQDLPGRQTPIWLKIEHYDQEPKILHHSQDTTKDVMEELKSLLETNAEPFSLKAPMKTSKFRKTVRFDQSQQTQPVTQTITQAPKQTVDISTPQQGDSAQDQDLATIKDFCEYFQQLQVSSGTGLCLGTLRDAHIQRFYSSSLGAAAYPSRSLSDIIAWVAEEPILRSMSRPAMIELASTLADGIMQFYSTPWLSKHGLGQSVRFFEVSNTPNAITQLKSPHFMAKLKRPSKGKERATESVNDEEAANSSNARFFGARNDLLFNFGILLLEIGFGQPWPVLKASILKNIGGDQLSNYLIAEKLANLLVRQMGLTYPRVIRQCLGCDFGLGQTDLDDEELQQKFLEDVVGELQQLEQKMSGNRPA